MSINYRKALPTEADIIAQFQLDMAKETEGVTLDLNIVKKGIAAVFEEPHLGTFYVCTLNNNVVGSLMLLTEWSEWRNGTVWWIHSLYIQPNSRGNKLFSGFFNYLRSLGQSTHGVRGLRLYVDNRNTSAQRIYSHLGMNGDHYRVFETMW